MRCFAGFRGDGKTCEDVDECAAGSAQCQQTCTNTLGGYECSCRDGFQLVPSLCPSCKGDVDKCWPRSAQLTLLIALGFGDTLAEQSLLWEMHASLRFEAQGRLSIFGSLRHVHPGT